MGQSALEFRMPGRSVASGNLGGHPWDSNLDARRRGTRPYRAKLFFSGGLGLAAVPGRDDVCVSLRALRT